MKLIAFTGSMGSGKSTAINILKESTGADLHLVKFAQPLYDMQEFIYAKISSVYKRPESFIKDRKLLQWLGTEWGRNSIKDSLWTDLWKEEVTYALENYPYKLIVCDDVRFDNEADAVKSLGGLIIKLQANNTGDRININSGIAGHSSEQGISLDKIDFVINNNGTIDDLKNSLLSLNLFQVKG